MRVMRTICLCAVVLLGWQWLYVAGAATVALTVWRAGVRRFSAFGG